MHVICIFIKEVNRSQTKFPFVIKDLFRILIIVFLYVYYHSFFPYVTILEDMGDEAPAPLSTNKLQPGHIP
jgi:hypothetical protein